MLILAIFLLMKSEARSKQCEIGTAGCTTPNSKWDEENILREVKTIVGQPASTLRYLHFNTHETEANGLHWKHKLK